MEPSHDNARTVGGIKFEMVRITYPNGRKAWLTFNRTTGEFVEHPYKGECFPGETRSQKWDQIERCAKVRGDLFYKEFSGNWDQPN